MTGKVAIVAGVRTPFAKAFTDLANLSAFDLALITTKELLQRSQVPASRNAGELGSPRAAGLTSPLSTATTGAVKRRLK